MQSARSDSEPLPSAAPSTHPRGGPNRAAEQNPGRSRGTTHTPKNRAAAQNSACGLFKTLTRTASTVRNPCSRLRVRRFLAHWQTSLCFVYCFLTDFREARTDSEIPWDQGGRRATQYCSFFFAAPLPPLSSARAHLAQSLRDRIRILGARPWICVRRVHVRLWNDTRTRRGSGPTDSTQARARIFVFAIFPGRCVLSASVFGLSFSHRVRRTWAQGRPPCDRRARGGGGVLDPCYQERWAI